MLRSSRGASTSSLRRAVKTGAVTGQRWSGAFSVVPSKVHCVGLLLWRFLKRFFFFYEGMAWLARRLR